MIQLRKTSVIINHDALGRLRSSFEKNHCVALPGLLDPELQEMVASRLDGRPWARTIHAGIGEESALDDPLSRDLLHFVVNAPAFLDAVRKISGRADIALFKEGRVYRLMPTSAHYISWHNDLVGQGDARLVGMSVNLGARRYSGGVLQVRDEATGIVAEAANADRGDATLFNISSRLRHQVTAVTGKEPRLAFAGWFTAGAEDYFAPLRRVAAGDAPVRPAR